MDVRLIYLDRVILVSLASFVVFSFFSISLTQISCGVGGLSWVVKCFLARSWGSQKFPLKVPFLLFVFACILGMVNSPDVSESFKSLKRLLEILIFFWAVNCISNEKLKEQLSLLLIASAAFSTLTGFYTAWEKGISYGVRVEGTMSVYMTYAGLLMLAIIIAVGKLVFNPKEHTWVYIALTLMVACLMLTFTRQAWFGVFAGVFFLIWFREKKLFWLLPPILGFVFLISPDNIKQRIETLTDLRDYNLQTRIALWQGGWLVFKDHPLTGCGFKCIDALHQDYPDPTGHIKNLRGLHSNFVQLAVDTGWFGLVSWLSIWAIYFVMLYRRIISIGNNSDYKRDAMVIAAAIAGFLFAGFFETNFYDSEVSMLVYFIMALPFAANGKSLVASEKKNLGTTSPRI